MHSILRTESLDLGHAEHRLPMNIQSNAEIRPSFVWSWRTDISRPSKSRCFNYLLLADKIW